MSNLNIVRPAWRSIMWSLLAVLFAASAYAQQQLPDGPGKDTFVRICSACHGAQIVIGRGNTQDGWTQVVLNMVARGAQGSEEEFGEIVQYLTKNFPPQSGGAAATASKVNVNKAAAPELKTELELSDKEAAAIVSYRQQNGDFKSVEQLEKVPGLDASKIEAKKSRIIF